MTKKSFNINIKYYTHLFSYNTEILDYGFPQTTDADSIKNLITTQSKAIKKVIINTITYTTQLLTNKLQAREDQISQITIQTTGKFQSILWII